VASFLITKSDLFLAVWEVFTIIGAIVLLSILLDISKCIGISVLYKDLMMVFMSCTICLTSLAHFVNIAVTRILLENGVEIPTYFQIGYWPSIEMSIDYLAWGLFMGLSFLVVGIAISPKSKYKTIKNTILVCSFLCFSGFLGAVLINQNFWYLAPLGYGFGTIIICIEMIKYKQ